MQNLGYNIRVTNLMGDTTGTAAPTTEAPGVVDMSGWGACLFMAISSTTSWGTAQDMFIKEAATTAATFITLEAGGAVVAGSSADSTSKNILIIDVKKPHDRYLMAAFTSGTTGDIRDVIAIQYDPLEGAVSPTTATPVYDPIVSGGIVVVATPTTA